MKISKIFPDILPTTQELEFKYSPRNISKDAMITRVGPSPTGFMHIGTLYIALLSERFAHQSNGIFYLRIEDTDKKREVEGATDFISQSFQKYGIQIDEGRDIQGVEHGNYGPYTQSERKEIYHSYVKDLLERGLAYPCFSSVEELDAIRKQQEKEKVPIGYYGKWALWRYKSDEEIDKMLETGKPYVIRFKSNGNPLKRISVNDMIFEDLSLPENNQDIVIMKSDGLPTYHLAHVIDDHLMRTTHVIRGSEWLPSLPIHLQLFEAFGWDRPKYAHIMPIQKLEGSSKRKLSKRKDPEANIGYFDNAGYLPEALIDYLLTLASSDFEDWRKQNPDKHNKDFILSIQKLRQSSGPLFDFDKLDNISREIISRQSTDNLYKSLISWLKIHDKEFYSIVDQNKEYTKKILSIERGGERTRKDYANFSDIVKDLSCFYDESFNIEKNVIGELISPITMDDAKAITTEFMSTYNYQDSKEEWFEKIKKIALNLGFATSTGEYKKNPSAFKGGVADLVKVYRVLLTGKAHTPDLYSIMQVMGEERVQKRLSAL